MENLDRTQNRGGHGQGGKPNQGLGRKGNENDRDREAQKGGSPTPSGVPMANSHFRRRRDALSSGGLFYLYR